MCISPVRNFALTIHLNTDCSPELKVLSVPKCDCRSVALQLLQRGLFPCAPESPTLAVDMSLLEHVKDLFLRLPPNITGWCDTLEAFLGKRKYKLKTRVSVNDTLSLFMFLSHL